MTQLVTPRAPAPTQNEAVLATGMFGDDGEELDPLAPWGIDPATGRFSGTPPPTDALQGTFAPLVPQLLPSLSLSARIDSINVLRFDNCTNGNNPLGSCAQIFVTFDNNGTLTQFEIQEPWPTWSAFGGPSIVNTSLGAQAIAADPTSAARFGIPDGFSQFNATVAAGLRQYIQFSNFEGQANRRGFAALNGNLGPGGSRWFSGDDETVDHPAASIRVGTVPEADTIWSTIHHTDYIPDDGGVTTYATSGQMQCFGYMHGMLGRQADTRITWGGGTITARDLTHHVDINHSSLVSASWGFVGDNNGDGVIHWRDFDHIQNVAFNLQALGFCASGEVTGATATLSATPIVGATSTDGNVRNGAGATGTGFGLYINGERFIFELPGGALPADGTEWTLRQYAGIVSAQNDESSTPTSYSYAPTDRSPIIPGLSVQFTVDNSTSAVASTEETLDAVHTLQIRTM